MPDTTTLPLSEQFYDLNLRLGRIVHLPTCGGSDMDEDIVDWMTGNGRRPLGTALGYGDDPETFDALLAQYGEDNLRDGLAEVIDRCANGWLIEAEQAVYMVSDSGMVSFTWGYYETKVIAGGTFDDAVAAALAWATENQVAAYAERDAKRAAAGS